MNAITILDHPISCSCGWSGRLYDAEPESNDSGELCCPVCGVFMQITDTVANDIRESILADLEVTMLKSIVESLQ